MNPPPLLAVLADRFVSQRENLATEPLAHIFDRSETARSSAIQTFRRLGAKLPHPLIFRTQAYGPDQVIPDLVGEDVKGIQHLVIEAKFLGGTHRVTTCAVYSTNSATGHWHTCVYRSFPTSRSSLE